MKTYHKDLKKRWHRLSLFEQMANVGSEVERAISWKEKGNDEYSSLAFERALELLDFTVETVRELHRLRELLRLREVLVDYFVCSLFLFPNLSTKDILDKLKILPIRVSDVRCYII